mmetsp:Transcript_29901/g.26450  ORF Transcript_29901/g.26450 Transcript_29901/m.26450 type:complete len:130 (+) Transcript_29901:423-812(+)
MPAGDNNYHGVNSLLRRSVAALLSGSLTILFSYPFDLLFTRITADMTSRKSKRLYMNTFDCFNLTQLEGGVKQLYRGAPIALFSILPSTLIMIPTYDLIQSSQKDNSPKGFVSKYIGSKFAAGFIAMML